MERRSKFAAVALVAAILVAVSVYYLNDRSDSSLASDWENSARQVMPDKTHVDRAEARQSDGRKNNFNSDAYLNSSVGFLDVKTAAFRGDATSQRILSEMYESCFAYSLSPITYMEGLDGLVQFEPRSAPYIRDMKERQKQFCVTVDDGAPIPLVAFNGWLEKAADSGDLAAAVRLKARSLEILNASEYQSIAASVISSHDPVALFELGGLLARAPADSSLGKYQNLAGPSAGHAIEIVACRRGLNCAAGSSIMDGICVNTGRCWYPNYEKFVYAELIPPGGRRQVRDVIETLNIMLQDS